MVVLMKEIKDDEAEIEDLRTSLKLKEESRNQVFVFDLNIRKMLLKH